MRSFSSLTNRFVAHRKEEHASTKRRAPKPPLANFDSASTMARALGRFLAGRDFPLLGLYPSWMRPAWHVIGGAVNALPLALKQKVYIYSGWVEARSPRKVARVRTNDIARWAVAQYPRKRYPAAMIGSSNGALMHLCAAFGIPWLPQTILLPVRHGGVPPDEPAKGLDWGRGPGAELLAANPDLALHHMHDPNQDHLMIQVMSYFRVKLLSLPAAYQEFLIETVEPGGTLYTVECNLRWPAVRVGERHVFQCGAFGGLTPREYLHGSRRVTDFLARAGSKHQRWMSPDPDTEAPEAEWGFEPRLRKDIERFTREHGFRLRRIVFNHPEDPSPLVADFLRAAYRSRGLPGNRLLMSNFIVMEPYWTIHTGTVPFWTVFNVESSAGAIERYLDRTEPFDEIYLFLFAHGVESAGLAPITRWRAVAERAKHHGDLLGADPDAYPRDFAIYTRYYDALRERIRARHALPLPVPLRELQTFIDTSGSAYRVEWS